MTRRLRYLAALGLPALLLALLLSGGLAPAADAAARTVHFDGAACGCRRPGRSTGSPSTRGCACGSTGAPSTSARPARQPALPGRGDRAAAGDPGRTARGRQRLGARAAAAPGGATRLGRRQRLHRARLRRLQRALLAVDGGLGGLALPGDRRLHRRRSTAACSQPNLTASWVSAQTDAGWHLIPTYVGLQAPTSACCSCAKLTSSQATAQGAAAAVDAVAEAGAVAMGPGSPIYFDMESYSRTSSATAATLAFLEAWTEKLHALGYVSGVYSSSASGIADLAGQVGTGYVLPDDLWIANWNGQAEHRRPGRARQRLDPAPAHPPVPRRPRRDLRRRDDQHRQQLRRRRRRSAPRTPGRPATDPIGSLDLVGSPAPGPGAGQGLGLRPQRADRTAGDPRSTSAAARAPRASSPTTSAPIANRPRRDVGAKYPRGRARTTASTLTFPTVKSGRQPVCVYALNLGAGDRPPARLQVDDDPGRGDALDAEGDADRRAGCGSPANGRPGPTARASSPCAPASRSPLPHRRGTPPRIRAVTRSLGRRAFQPHRRQAPRLRDPAQRRRPGAAEPARQLQTQLIAAIPGGRRIVAVGLGRSAASPRRAPRAGCASSARSVAQLALEPGRGDPRPGQAIGRSETRSGSASASPSVLGARLRLGLAIHRPAAARSASSFWPGRRSWRTT